MDTNFAMIAVTAVATAKVALATLGIIITIVVAYRREARYIG